MSSVSKRPDTIHAAYPGANFNVLCWHFDMGTLGYAGKEKAIKEKRVTVRTSMVSCASCRRALARHPQIWALLQKAERDEESVKKEGVEDFSKASG